MNCTNCNEIKSGRNLDFLEIDAASKTGIDDMRDLSRNCSPVTIEWEIQSLFNRRGAYAV